MAEFSVNADRFDPYQNFQFRICWDGRYVAGFAKVGALNRTTAPVSMALRHGLGAPGILQDGEAGLAL